MAGKASERFVWAVDTLEVRPADRLLEVGWSVKDRRKPGALRFSVVPERHHVHRLDQP
jgi:hypothetical protein